MTSSIPIPNVLIKDEHIYSCTVKVKSHSPINSAWKNSPIINSKENNLPTTVPPNEDKWYSSSRVIICLVLWYFFSFTTLFLNKYILSYKKVDPVLLGSSQLFSCSIWGFTHLKYPCNIYNYTTDQYPPNFYTRMLLLGILRFTTLFLGLVALWYVPVSFAETVKSSAPVFTVFLAWVLMSEKTSWLVIVSLIPVMSGLVLCSANELSFSFIGFIAAMTTNLSECLQNVYSKKMLSGDLYKCSPPELQFYTSIASLCAEIPALMLTIDIKYFQENSISYIFMLLTVNGISFHCQSMTEYTLLGYISPVTHSVANTVKRAFMIWLSVIIFGNTVTFLGWVGTGSVIIGVFAYNKARQISPSTRSSLKESKSIHTV